MSSKHENKKNDKQNNKSKSSVRTSKHNWIDEYLKCYSRVLYIIKEGKKKTN